MENYCSCRRREISRIKHTLDFPVKSINFCLNEAEIDISNLDVITINSNPFSYIDKKILFTLKRKDLMSSKSLSNLKRNLK